MVARSKKGIEANFGLKFLLPLEKKKKKRECALAGIFAMNEENYSEQDEGYDADEGGIQGDQHNAPEDDPSLAEAASVGQ